MHYYAFHIGDFTTSTFHLSWDERAAFRVLLDEYYFREQPLPADAREIYRRVRASTTRQQRAVDEVLRQFFELTDAGWASARCDDEISKSCARRQRSSAGGQARARRMAEGGGTGEPGPARMREGHAPGSPPARAGVAPEAHLGDAPGSSQTHAGRAPAGTPAHARQAPGSAQAQGRQETGAAPNPITNPNPNPSASSNAACGEPRATAVPATGLADTPASVGDWIVFLGGEGFEAESLDDPGMRSQMHEWVGQRIGLPLMRRAIEQACLRLGSMPATPACLAPIVSELFAAQAQDGAPDAESEDI